jgi:hypothetical protein
MMRGHITLFLITIGFSFLASSQSIKHTISEEYKTEGQYRGVFLLPDVKGKKRFITKHKNENILVSLTGKSRFKEKRIEHPFEEAEYNSLLRAEEHLYNIILENDSRSRSLKLLAIKYDAAGKKVDRKLLKKLDAKDYNDPPTLWTRVSADRSKLAILLISDNNDKNDDYKMEAYVMDRNLEILNSISFKKKGKKIQRLYSLKNVELTNDGELFYTMKIYNEKDKEKIKIKGRSVPNYRYEVVSHKIDGYKEVNILDIKKRFIYDSGLYLMEDQSPMVVLDFRNEPETENRLTGLLTFKRESSSSTWSSKVKTFNNTDYFEMFMDDINWGRHYALSHQSVASGDLLHVLYERTFLRTRIQNNGPIGNRRTPQFSTTIVEKSHSNALVLTFNKDGEMVDHTFIPKYFKTGEDGEGTKLVRHKDSWALVYADRKSNFDRPIDDYKKFDNTLANKRIVIMAAYVDNEELVIDYIQNSGEWAFSVGTLMQSDVDDGLRLAISDLKLLKKPRISLLDFRL